ncbi:hypothetical protein HDU93_002068, partial [Gonapodya sp. JEL0774]
MPLAHDRLASVLSQAGRARDAFGSVRTDREDKSERTESARTARNTAGVEKKSILSLPADLLLHVFLLLPATALGRAPRVCRKWQAVLSEYETTIWSERLRNDFGVDAETEAMARNFLWGAERFTPWSSHSSSVLETTSMFSVERVPSAIECSPRHIFRTHWNLATGRFASLALTSVDSVGVVGLPTFRRGEPIPSVYNPSVPIKGNISHPDRENEPSGRTVSVTVHRLAPFSSWVADPADVYTCTVESGVLFWIDPRRHTRLLAYDLAAPRNAARSSTGDGDIQEASTVTAESLEATESFWTIDVLDHTQAFDPSPTVLPSTSSATGASVPGVPVLSPSFHLDTTNHTIGLVLADGSGGVVSFDDASTMRTWNVRRSGSCPHMGVNSPTHSLTISSSIPLPPVPPPRPTFSMNVQGATVVTADRRGRVSLFINPGFAEPSASGSPVDGFSVPRAWDDWDTVNVACWAGRVAIGGASGVFYLFDRGAPGWRCTRIMKTGAPAIGEREMWIDFDEDDEMDDGQEDGVAPAQPIAQDLAGVLTVHQPETASSVTSVPPSSQPVSPSIISSPQDRAVEASSRSLHETWNLTVEEQIWDGHDGTGDQANHDNALDLLSNNLVAMEDSFPEFPSNDAAPSEMDLDVLSPMDGELEWLQSLGSAASAAEPPQFSNLQQRTEAAMTTNITEPALQLSEMNLLGMLPNPIPIPPPSPAH